MARVAGDESRFGEPRIEIEFLAEFDKRFVGDFGRDMIFSGSLSLTFETGGGAAFSSAGFGGVFEEQAVIVAMIESAATNDFFVINPPG